MKPFDANYKRNFIIHSKSSNRSLPISRNISPDVSPKRQNFKEFESPRKDNVARSTSTESFKPIRKVYVELAPSDNFFDLQGKSILNDYSSLLSISSTKHFDERRMFLIKDYKRLVRKAVHKAQSDKQDLGDDNFATPYFHPKSRLFFKEVKMGNMKEVIQMLLQYPELIKTVDCVRST